jgi:serine/threonine protein phosphatase PrpC
MSIDLSLLLQSASAALENDQLQQGMFLVNYAMRLAEEYEFSLRLSALDAAIALDRGKIRKVNEDCVLAIHGTLPGTGKVFGLFVICDGMGGHAEGQKAACLASQTIIETVFPLLMHEYVATNGWGQVLVRGVEQANHVLYLHNRQRAARGITIVPEERTMRAAHINPMMGSTVTAVLLLDTTAYIANVGDSRTYIYVPGTGLAKITKDHSVVAALLDQGMITEKDVYVHPRRNQITRCLGHRSSIEVDLFSMSLPKNAVLLLCSDGLWEMMRDPAIADILQLNWASAGYMVRQLLDLVMEGSALDNISLIVVQPDGRKRNDFSTLATLRQLPLQEEAQLIGIAR